MPAYLAVLSADGWSVSAGPLSGPDDLRRARRRPPSAFVVDLARAPVTGRDVGLALRQYAATRRVPLVFVGGDAARVLEIRRLLPDAVFCSPDQVEATLRRLTRRAVATIPSRPASGLAGYSGTPLPRKLGIVPGATVVLVRAPEGFESRLGPLPDGVVVRRRNQGRRDITLWFTRSRRELATGMARMAEVAGEARLWIAWPKRSSALAADHTETDVRHLGLAAGLVDYKICAIDDDWSGLLFTRRRSMGER